uniref:Uncharacterized protein n=1 Tax=Cucumis melo TaxID=3656 RepID=A0A9I9EM51_CUCME
MNFFPSRTREFFNLHLSNLDLFEVSLKVELVSTPIFSKILSFSFMIRIKLIGEFLLLDREYLVWLKSPAKRFSYYTFKLNLRDRIVIPTWVSFEITIFLGLRSLTDHQSDIDIDMIQAKVKVEESWRATEKDP